MIDHNDVERGKDLIASGKYAPQSKLAAAIDTFTSELIAVDNTEVEIVSPPEHDSAIDGAEFILDQPQGVPAIWGRGQQVLWAAGETLMIAGGQGLGKTTLAVQLVKESLGLGGGKVLGLPVADTGCKILYLAMDRPQQISRAMRRQFTDADRDVLSERLTIWKGPPPRDLAANPALLAKMAKFFGAGVVYVDSLKDAAVGLSEDAVGAQWNRARQHLLAQGVQLCELHHTKKPSMQSGSSPTVSDVYGSTWLTSGAGSVILLTGEPGDPVLSFRHVKQPAEEVGPYQLLHDQINGVMSVEFSIDLVEMVKNSGIHGLTAKDAAVAITEKLKPTKADIEKARRRLEQKVSEGVLVRVDGHREGEKGSTPAAWFLSAEESQR